MNLITFRFPDSGNVIQLKRLPPHAADHALTAARQALAGEKPTPPLASNSDLGIADEPDYQNPGYLAALRIHENKIYNRCGELIARLIARRCVFEIDQQALAEYRQDLADLGMPLPEDQDDREVYLFHLLAETPDDLAALQKIALGQSKPDPEAVQAHVDSFRGDVPRS